MSCLSASNACERSMISIPRGVGVGCDRLGLRENELLAVHWRRMGVGERKRDGIWGELKERKSCCRIRKELIMKLEKVSSDKRRRGAGGRRKVRLKS